MCYLLSLIQILLLMMNIADRESVVQETYVWVRPLSSTFTTTSDEFRISEICAIQTPSAYVYPPIGDESAEGPDSRECTYQGIVTGKDRIPFEGFTVVTGSNVSYEITIITNKRSKKVFL